MAHPDTDVVRLDRIQKMYKQAKILAQNEKKRRGESVIPGMEGMAAPNPNLDPNSWNGNQSEDKFVTGKLYTDKNGNKAIYKGNGQWEQQ